MSLRFASQTVLPRGPRHLVHRPRLTAALSSAVDGRLALIIAPAGSGKTSLLIDLAHGLDRPVAWLALDEWLADPVELVRAIAAAVDAVAPGVSSRVEPILAGDLAEEIRLRRALVELVNCMASVPRAVLAMDDWHRVAGDGRTAETLNALVMHLPPGWCLLLAGRRLPELACASKLALEGELYELPPEQLALTVEETHALLRALRGEHVSADLAERLWTTTGGWAAALLLCAQVGADAASRGAPELLQPGADLFDYLARHLLDGLSPTDRHLLLRAAVPRLLNVESFALVRGYAVESELTLEPGAALPSHPGALTRRYGFMMRGGDHDGGYRLHDLLRGFLLTEAQRTAPRLVAGLHVELARLCEARGDEASALYHLREARAWPELAATACRTVEKRRRQGRWRSAAEFVDALPEEVLTAEPLLRLVRAEARCHTGEAERALTELAALSAHLTGPANALLRARALSLRGTALRLTGAHAAAVEDCKQAELLLLAIDAPSSLRAHAQRELGLALAATGRYEEALQVLRQAIEVFEVLGEASERSTTHDCIAGALLQLGRVAEATSHLERARRGWSELQNGSALALTLNNLGVAYANLGDVELAAEMLGEAKRQAEASDHQRAAVAALLSLADLRRDQGDGQALAELAAEALERARKLDEPGQVFYAMQALAQGHHLLGDSERAETLAREAVGAATEQGGPFEQGLAALTLGAVLRDRQAAAGEAELRRAVELLDGCGAANEAIRARLELAVALNQRGQAEEAAGLVAATARAAVDLKLETVLRRYASRAPSLFADAALRFAEMEALRPFAAQAGAVCHGRTHAHRAGAPMPAAAEDAGGHAVLPRVSAHAFGRLRVLMNGEEVADQRWESEKARELLFFLLAHPGMTSGLEIATALWPGLDADSGRKALHSTVYRLRRALYPECVINLRNGYGLNPQGPFWFDAAEFRGLTKSYHELEEEEYRERIERAVALYAGPLVLATLGDWADGLRSDCEERYLRALNDLSGFYFRQGRLDRAAELATRAFEADPICEASARVLFECRLQQGDMAGALRTFRRYRDRAVADGLEPTAEFAGRHKQVVSGNYALALA